MERETQIEFGGLCGVAAAMVLGNSMLIPVLPVLKRALAIDQVRAGLIITAFSVAAGLSIPVAGFLSDRFGRKNIIVPALLLYGIAGVASGLAPVISRALFWPMLAARAIQGVGAGGTYQIAMALTGDIFQSKERRAALGYLEASNGGGKVIAPLAGASLGMLHWSAPFYLYGAVSIPVAAAVWFTIKEPLSKREAKPIGTYAKSVKQIFGKKAWSILASFFAGLMVLFLYFGVLANLADVLEAERNLTGILLGLVIAVPVSAMALTSFFGGRWFKQMPARAIRLLASGGLGLATVGLIGAALLREHVLLVGSTVVMSIGNGLVLPSLNTLITSSAGLEERGLITSLYGTTRHIGAASGPPVFGLLVGAIGNWVYLVAAVFAALASLLVYFVVKESLMMAGPKTGKDKEKDSGKELAEHHPRLDLA